MSHLFTWGGQSTGVSALASFPPKKSQGWALSEWTGWISLQSKGLSRVFSNTTVQKHQFFSAQLSYPYVTTVGLIIVKVKKVKVTQSCPALCDPMDYTVHGILQTRILEWVALFLLQGIFPTQGLNPDLPHCRQILYQLSYQGSPIIIKQY